LIVNNKRV